jgi:hypothetical protein
MQAGTTFSIVSWCESTLRLTAVSHRAVSDVTSRTYAQTYRAPSGVFLPVQDKSRTSSIHSQHTRNLKYVETCVIQIPVDTLATQIPRGVRGVPQCMLRPVRCVSRLPPVFWNRYARADDMVYIHTSQTEGHAEAAIDGSADCSGEPGDDPAEALAV